MSMRRLVNGTAGAVGLAAIVLAGLLLSHGHHLKEILTSEGGESTSASSASGPAAQERLFLDVTAAYMCKIQTAVYPDESARAAARRSQPPYPAELSRAQIKLFQIRLRADTAFAQRLHRNVRDACPSTGT